MKKIISIIAVLVLSLSFASCGNTNAEESEQTASAAEESGKLVFTTDTPVEDVTKYLTLDTLFTQSETVSLQWYNVNYYSDEYTQSNEFYTHLDDNLCSYTVFVNLTSEETMEVWNNYDGVSTYVIYSDVPFHTLTVGLPEQMAQKNQFAFDYSLYDSKIEDVKTDENGFYEIQIGAYASDSLQCMGSYVIDPENGVMQKCTENYFYGAETPYIVSACVVSLSADEDVVFNPVNHFESGHQLTINYNGSVYTALVDNDTDIEFVDAALDADYAVYHIYSDSAMENVYINATSGHVGKVNQATELWISAE